MANDNLIFEHLRAIRSDIAAIRETQTEPGQRLTSLEQGQADLKRLLSHKAEHAADQSARIDRLFARLDRVEKRLDLTE